jgi:hypothetical protein
VLASITGQAIGLIKQAVAVACATKASNAGRSTSQRNKVPKYGFVAQIAITCDLLGLCPRFDWAKRPLDKNNITNSFFN